MLEGSDRVIIVTEPPDLLPSREALGVSSWDAGPQAFGYTLSQEMRLRMRLPREMSLSLSAITGPYHGETLPDSGNQGCYSG